MDLNECFNDHYISMLLALKLNQLKREDITSLSLDDLKSSLYSMCVKRKVSQYHQVVDIILNTSSQDLIAHSFMQARIDGQKMSINDFSDMFIN